MPQEPPDDLDRELLDPLLVALYREELSELAGDSCRDRIAEMFEDRWSTLALHACNRRDRRKGQKPTKQDALDAFDSLKHTFFIKDSDFLEFSLVELWRLLIKLPLGTLWTLIGAAFGIFSVIGVVAFWLGTHFGK